MRSFTAEDAQARLAPDPRVLHVHGAAADGPVAQPAAVADVADRVIRDPGDPDLQRVPALLDEAVPGAPGGGAGLGQRLLPVLPAAPAEGVADGGVDGREVGSELVLGLDERQG